MQALVPCLFFVSFFICASFGANPASLVLLTNSLSDGAACLDGSAPAFYFQKGTGTGANKWQIHHEGGGWCTSLADCYGRSRTGLGSSKGYGQSMDLPFGYLSNDPSVNPQMYNWNKVYLKYCDGGSFSGNNKTVSNYNGNNLYFRGFLNLNAYAKALYANYGLRSATDVVVGGCSAGGLATYLHLDWWHAVLPNAAKVRGLPDSGFFLDYDSSKGNPHYATDMRWVFTQMNSTDGVNQRCIAGYPAGSKFKCFFAEHVSPFIATPFFPLQSEYDSWQTANILGSNDASQINTFGQLLTTRFKANVVADPSNGGFLDSCFHHCAGFSLSINSEKASATFQRWYETGKNGVRIDGKTYPCTACCAQQQHEH